MQVILIKKQIHIKNIKFKKTNWTIFTIRDIKKKSALRFGFPIRKSTISCNILHIRNIVYIHIVAIS